MDRVKKRSSLGVLKYGLLLAVLAIGWRALAPPSAAAEAIASLFDISGEWRVEIEHDRRCRWQGRVRLTQTGSELAGSGEAAPTAARRFCPRLQGGVAGSVDGHRVQFGFATGRLGTGEFDGELASNGRGMRGTWTARSAAGTWRAELLERAD